MGTVLDFATREKWRIRGEEFRHKKLPTEAPEPFALAHDPDSPFEFTHKYYEVDAVAMARFFGYQLPTCVSEDTPPLESC